MPSTLLLADDSVTIQKVVGISFANEDVVLVTVSNGTDAIAKAKEVRPDIVLADVVMPGKNGYEVCEALKSDPSLRHVPVLLLTGTFEAFDEARARAVGADGHITKPFEAQALVDTVNARLRAPRPAPAPASAPAAPEPVAPPAALDEPFDFLEEEPTAPRPAAAAPDAGRTTLLMGDATPLDDGDDAFSFDAEEGDADAFALEDEEPFASTAVALEPDTHPEVRAVAARDAGDDVTRIVLAGEAPPAAASFADDALDDMFGGEEEPVALAPAPALVGSFDAQPDAIDGESIEESFPESPLARSEPEPIAAFAQDEDPYGDTLARSEPLVDAPRAAAPSAPGAAPDLSPLLRQQLHETLEKIAWESLGDVAERIVRETVARVEEVAWEVIPRMAETLIREEIRKLKRGE